MLYLVSTESRKAIRDPVDKVSIGRSTGDLVTTVPATSSRLREKKAYGRGSTISFKQGERKNPSRPDTSDKTACLLILEDEKY